MREEAYSPPYDNHDDTSWTMLKCNSRSEVRYPDEQALERNAIDCFPNINIAMVPFPVHMKFIIPSVSGTSVLRGIIHVSTILLLRHLASQLRPWFCLSRSV
jgi:hypothetical protein